jgi:hypothetical protein
MLIKKSFEIPLYRGRFIIMFSDKKVKISDHYDDLGNKLELNYGHCFIVNSKVNKQWHESYLVTFNIGNKFRKITPGVIAHEVFHATYFILRDRGMKVADKSDEAYSYLIEWMTDKIYEIMKKNNIVL